METKERDIYRRGAEWGIPMGAIFIALFFVMVYGMTHPMLNLAGLALFVAIPVVTYRSLRQTHVECHGLTTFSGLWMQGITMFFCASVLASFVGFIYMRWIQPDMLAQVCLSAAEAYDDIDSPTAQELAADLRKMVELHLVPQPSSIVMGWMWLGVFLGSILSMIVSWIVRMRKVGTVKELGR